MHKLAFGAAEEAMRLRKNAVAALCTIAIAPWLWANSAQAQAARSYVSGTGTDSASCTVSAPCQTLQAALTATAPGGEIYVLNSANYGPATIDKAVTITSEGAVASVLATTGVGITINAGANDDINLRGLDIDGGNSGSDGIRFKSGRSLNIQKSAVRGFTNAGIAFAPTATSTLFVTDTVVTNNAAVGITVFCWFGAASAVLNVSRPPRMGSEFFLRATST